MKRVGEHCCMKIDLRQEESLVFTNPQNIEFPRNREAKQNFLSSITSYMKGASNHKIEQGMVPIPSELLLLYNGNGINMYRYWQRETEELECELCSELELPYSVKNVKVSNCPKSLKEKDFYLLVESTNSNTLELLNFNCGDKKLRRVKLQKFNSEILCWSFIDVREILIWCNDMKIYHFCIKDNGLKLVQTLNSDINMQEELSGPENKSKTRSRSEEPGQHKQPVQKNRTFSLHFCCIIGQRGREQDSIILLFYVLYCEEMNGMKIKCKEIQYPFENEESYVQGFLYSYYNEYPKLKVLPNTYEIMSSNTANPEILRTLNIYQIEDAYLVRFESEIIIIQKKFNQYFAMDNVYKKTKDCMVTMCPNSNTVSCVSDNILEINEIQIGDNKIHSQLFDFIHLKFEYQNWNDNLDRNNLVDSEFNMLGSIVSKELGSGKKIDSNDRKFEEMIKYSKLYGMWVTQDLNKEQKSFNICFLFEIYLPGCEEKKYQMYITKHVSRIKKLTTLGHSVKNEGDLQRIQKLGENMGVNESEFYFNMWRTSKQGGDEILLYLLRCRNYKQVIQELKGFIRKKSYAIAKLLKVFQRLESMTLEILKEKLTDEFLIDYFHVIFVHRKFQIFESNYLIEEREFSEFLEISLYDLVKRIINKELFPEVKKTSLWMMEQKEAPKMNLLQVLDLFKFPLLEEYGSFLGKLLRSYGVHITTVVEKFPMVLPEYPFHKFEFIKKNPLEVEPSVTTNNKSQNEFFSPIKSETLNLEPSFLKNALKELYPFYPTSEIEKSFRQIMKRHEIHDKKFELHSIIVMDFDKYIEKVTEISGIDLYIVVLESEVMSVYNSQLDVPIEEKAKSKIKELCEIFERKENQGLDKEVSMELKTTAKLYELMINHSIIDPHQVSLERVFKEPIDKWIALFFLGNKQQKDLIFKDFMQIFDNEEVYFVGALKKFVASEHCSKIELSFLMDLITKLSDEFQRLNQKIINVIIEGFCSRVEIADTPDSNHFMERVRTIQLGPELLDKVDKIEKMKVCKRIFSVFSMDDILMKELMNSTESVLEEMLEKYFLNEYKEEAKIAISKKVVEIKEVSSMFEILDFLRKNVFFHLSVERLVIMYCKKLIEWQAFDEVENLIYNSPFIEDEGLNGTYLLQQVQLQILEELYEEETTKFDEQTIEYIEQVLSLDRDPENNLLLFRERARLELAEIFKKWDNEKTLKQMEDMCREWEETEDEENNEGTLGEIMVRPVMNRIIHENSLYMDKNSLEKVYECFLRMTSEQIAVPDIKSDEFYQYCTKLGSELMDENRLRETSEIICIVNERFEMNYWLMSSCLLRSISQIYLESFVAANSRDASMSQENGEKGGLGKAEWISETPRNDKRNNMLTYTPIVQQKEEESVNSEWIEEDADPLTMVKIYIDNFILNWKNKDEDRMKEMFGSFFSENLEYDIKEIDVNTDICFKEFRHRITTMFIWGMIEKICETEGIDRINMIYSYFFIHMGLVEPSLGFEKIEYIKYNQQILFTVLLKFKEQCDIKEELLFINYAIILEKYLDALTRLLISDQEEQNLEKPDESKDRIEFASEKNSNGDDYSKDNKNRYNLVVVRDLVKKGLYKHDPNAAIINKLSVVALEAKRNQKTRRENYEKLVGKCKIEKKNAPRVLHREKKTENNEEKKEDDDIVSEKERIGMMSFEQFMKLKVKIKNDKTLSLYVKPDMEICERTVVEEIYSQMGYNLPQVKNNSLKDFGLGELVLTSLREIENQQEEEKLEKMESSQVISVRKENFETHPLKASVLSRKEYKPDEELLIEAIKTENYLSINNWSTDAILLETMKVYHKAKEVHFDSVVRMFHELCVGDSAKVGILFIGEPENIKADSQIIKKIFTLEFVKNEFPSFEDYKEEMLNRIFDVVEDLTVSEIISIMSYIKEITKLQYKVVLKNIWLNIIGTEALSKLANSSDTFEFKLKRLDTLLKLFSQEFLKERYGELADLFNNQPNKQLLLEAKEKIFNSADIGKENAKN